MTKPHLQICTKILTDHRFPGNHNLHSKKIMSINSINSASQLDGIREQISTSLEKAQAQRNILKRNNVQYTTANIILGAISAVLAGTAGTIGKADSWKPTSDKPME